MPKSSLRGSVPFVIFVINLFFSVSLCLCGFLAFTGDRYIDEKVGG